MTRIWSEYTESQCKVLIGIVTQTGCKHSYSSRLEIPEPVTSHSNLSSWVIKHTHTLSTPKAPSRCPVELHTHCIRSPFHSLYQHDLQSSSPSSCRFSAAPRSKILFSMSLPVTHSVFSLFLPIYPPTHLISGHTNTVFRKQNNQGNMTGIWKR